MHRWLIVAISFTLAATLACSVSAQDASKIVGVWKVVDITRKEIASGATDKPYGEKPSGYYVFTAGGHFFWNFVADNRKPPAGSAPSDAERLELFKTLSFGTGTYKSDGGKLLLRYDSSWIQSWTGAERSISLPEVSGKTMTITSAPFKHPTSGVDAMTTNTFERVE